MPESSAIPTDPRDHVEASPNSLVEEVVRQELIQIKTLIGEHSNQNHANKIAAKHTNTFSTRKFLCGWNRNRKMHNLRSIRGLMQVAGIPGELWSCLEDVKDEDAMCDDTSKNWDDQITGLNRICVSVDFYVPEVVCYLLFILAVYLYDQKIFERSICIFKGLIKRTSKLGMRSLSIIEAKSFFFLGLCNEKTEYKFMIPDEYRMCLMDGLNRATEKKCSVAKGWLIPSILRFYLSCNEFSLAQKFVEVVEPDEVLGSDYARYLFYRGKLRAITLNYHSSREDLQKAIRKCPAGSSCNGFVSLTTKYLIIVELLMGDIPKLGLFRDKNLRLNSYEKLVRAVREGSVVSFVAEITNDCNRKVFMQDGTFSLIKRLRGSVLTVGIRLIRKIYTSISLQDVADKLGLENEEEALGIVSKYIKDGVIAGYIDHESRILTNVREIKNRIVHTSSDTLDHLSTTDSDDECEGNVYLSTVPLDEMNTRISSCVRLHDEILKSMVYSEYKDKGKSFVDMKSRRERCKPDVFDSDIDDVEFD